MGKAQIFYYQENTYFEIWSYAGLGQDFRKRKPNLPLQQQTEVYRPKTGLERHIKF